jgi:hypothetical protein
VKETEGAVTKYRLLFGRTVEAADTTDPTTKVPAIQLAELTPVFLQVLQTSKTTAAVQMFQDEVEHTVKGLWTSENFLYVRRPGRHVRRGLHFMSKKFLLGQGSL